MFGARKKRGSSKNSRKKNTKHFFQLEQSITPEMVEEAIQEANIPQELKETLLNELPNFVEYVDEATNKIFNPSAIWLESLQFADYVEQLASHLREECDEGCRKEVTEKLILMSENFKELAENAMTVIDKSEKRIHNHGS